MQTNVLIKEECILKNKNKSCPYKKFSMFYNSCLKTFGSLSPCMFASLCGFLVVLEEEEDEDAFLPFDNLLKNITFY